MTDEALARWFLKAMERPCASPGGFTRHGTFPEIATLIDGMVYASCGLRPDLPDPLKWCAFRWWLALQHRLRHAGGPRNLVWSAYIPLLIEGDAEAIRTLPRLYADFLTRRFPDLPGPEAEPATVPLLLLGWVDRWDQAGEVKATLSEFTACDLARIGRAVDVALDGLSGQPIALQVAPDRAMELLDRLDQLSFSACISHAEPWLTTSSQSQTAFPPPSNTPPAKIRPGRQIGTG